MSSARFEDVLARLCAMVPSESTAVETTFELLAVVVKSRNAFSVSGVAEPAPPKAGINEDKAGQSLGRAFIASTSAACAWAWPTAPSAPDRIRMVMLFG